MQSHTQQKSMVIGCGHGRYCQFLHPADKFITVDINPDCKPDIVADIGDFDALQQEFHHRFAPVSYLIFEHCPIPDETPLSKFMGLLDNNGYIIMIGWGSEVLSQLDINHKIWFSLGPKSNNSHTVIIIPKNPDHPAPKPDLDPDIIKHLSSYWKLKNAEQLKSLFVPYVISPEFASVMPSYNAYHTDSGLSFISNQARDCEVELFLKPETFNPPSKLELMNIINTYTPGLARKLFSGGKTDDMTTLINAVEQKNDPLSISDLQEIAGIAINRKFTTTPVISRLFVLPDNTETTRVCTAVYARIHAYLFSRDILQQPQLSPPSPK